MPKVDDMFPARFIQAKDLQGKAYNLRIREVVPVEVYDRGTRAKVQRWAVFFDGSAVGKKGPEKGLILNKTNALKLADLAGSEDSDNWPGTLVQMVPEMVRFGAGQVLAVRFRPAPLQHSTSPEEDPANLDAEEEDPLPFE